MSDRFVVEAGKIVAGVAVRAAGGFRFFTSHPDFKSIEGKTFRRARALMRRVRELAAARRRSNGAVEGAVQ